MKTSRNRYFGFIRIAASLALIALSGYLAWYFIDPYMIETGSEIAQNESTQSLADSTKNASDSSAIALQTAPEYEEKEEETANQGKSATDEDLEEETKREPIAETQIAVAEQENEGNGAIADDAQELIKEDLDEFTLDKPDSTATVDVEDALTGRIAGVEIAAEEETVTEEISKKLETDAPRTQRSAAKLAQPSAAAIEIAENLSITGRVLGESENDPLPGAYVMVKGTNNRGFTDVNGNYTLTAEPGSILVSSYAGYITQEIEVTDRTSLDFNLQADVSELSEVVVTGYAVNSTSDEVVEVSAQPEGGFASFRQFIREDLIYPQEAIDNDIKGRVVVLFNVNPDGSLYNFRIRHSLGYGCDEEAVRLIKEGPTWQPSTRNGQGYVDEVRVTVKFSDQ